jgi:hypothetical protein
MTRNKYDLSLTEEELQTIMDSLSNLYLMRKLNKTREKMRKICLLNYKTIFPC